MLALAKPVDLSAINVLPAVVGDLREDGCHADVQIAIGPTRLVARITRHSAARLALAPNKPVFAVIKSVAIDGGGLAIALAGRSISRHRRSLIRRCRSSASDNAPSKE